MKRIFTFLYLCLPLFAFGQTFELDPSKDIYQEHLVYEYSGDIINVKNISDEPIILWYETISNTFSTDWGCSFCAGDGCFTYFPESETLGEIEPGASSGMSCSMFFGEYPGEGTVVFKIFDIANLDNPDTISITYKVTDESTGTNNLVNEYNFSVNPNPITGYLNIVNDQIEQYEINIYNLTGQLILNEKASEKSWNGDLFSQNNGIYILTVTDENGLIYRQKISKI